MGLEKDQSRGRIRYRFDTKEIEKYAGKDVPHTVIKQWISQGRSLEASLAEIESIISNMPDDKVLDEINSRIKDLQITEHRSRKLLESLSEILINLSRVLLISSTIQSRTLGSLSESDRQLIKRFDKAFNHISTELFPEIRNDYFFNLLVKGEQQ